MYAISRTGITGTQQALATDAEESGRSACAVILDLPMAVGFGISNAEHFAAVGEFADAAVIGSALVRIIEGSAGRPKKRPARSRDLSRVCGHPCCRPVNSIVRIRQL